MKSLNLGIKNLNTYKIFIFIGIAIGIVLRILFFSYNRPFWNDECALALNIKNNWNFFIPLLYNQAAPQLFMYISKCLYSLIPAKEIALKIIPLLSSIGSLWLFYLLAKKYLTKKISIIVAIFTFSICYPLCYYAQEFKQYSSDVLCFIAILLSYFNIDKYATNKKKIIIYGTICAISIWLSFAAMFALSSIFLTILIFDREKLKKFKFAIIPTVISLILFYFSNKYLNSSEYLHAYWKQFFITKNLSNLPYLMFFNVEYVFNNILPLLFIISTIIISLIKDNKNKRFYLLSFPLITAILLSYFGIYPFSTRLILYLIPIFILLSVKILDFINIKNIFIKSFLFFLITFYLIIPPLLDSYSNIIKKNYTSENILYPLVTAINLAKENDIIYISEGNKILYEYYKDYINSNKKIIVEDTAYTNQNDYINHLKNLTPNKTYYWILAHNAQKKERVNSVYLWAKQKKDFQIYYDKNLNTLIIFTN